MIEMSGSEFLVAVLLSICSGFFLSNLMSTFKEQEKGENNKKGGK